MRIFLSIVGVLIVLAIIGLVVQPATWMWWALGALIVLGIGVPVCASCYAVTRRTKVSLGISSFTTEHTRPQS